MKIQTAARQDTKWNLPCVSDVRDTATQSQNAQKFYTIKANQHMIKRTEKKYTTSRTKYVTERINHNKTAFYRNLNPI